MEIKNKLNVWDDVYCGRWYRIDRRIRFFFRKIKWSYQRIRYGFCDRDLWSLDYTLANYIAATVTSLDEKRMGYPGHITDEEWGQILKSIATDFYMSVNDDDYFISGSPNEVRLQEGFHLLQKWFYHLWW